MDITNQQISDNPDCVVITTRILSATLEQAFKAWTDPNHLSKWWGPKGFTNTFHEYELRPGGKWLFTMHSETGIDYPNECEFISMDEPNSIAWNHISNPVFKILVRFTSIDPNNTQVEFNMIFPTPEACQKIKQFVTEKNEENMDRLEIELLNIQ